MQRPGSRFQSRRLRLFLLHLRRSPPECLSQSPEAACDPLRVENFSPVPAGPNRTAGSSLAPTLPPTPLIYRERWGAFPVFQTHPDAGFLKRKDRQTAGSAPGNPQGRRGRRGGAGVGRLQRLGRERPASRLQSPRKQWPAIPSNAAAPVGAPESLRRLHPGLFYRTINACGVCSATCF